MRQDNDLLRAATEALRNADLLSAWRNRWFKKFGFYPAAKIEINQEKPQLHLVRNQHSNVGVTKFPRHRHQFGTAKPATPPDAA